MEGKIARLDDTVVGVPILMFLLPPESEDELLWSDLDAIFRDWFVIDIYAISTLAPTTSRPSRQTQRDRCDVPCFVFVCSGVVRIPC